MRAPLKMMMLLPLAVLSGTAGAQGAGQTLEVEDEMEAAGLAIVEPGGGTQYGPVNVMAYAGVDPTGNLDSLPAIKLALAEAKAGTRKLYFPAGRYKVSGTINLDWESVTVLGDGSGLMGTVILTTSTSLPIFSIPADYNNVRIENLKIIGPGRMNSTSSGIYIRGDLGGNSNVDFLKFRSIRIDGFQTGIYLKAVANSILENVCLENNTIGIDSLGNNNSNIFMGGSFGCGAGPVDAIGMRMSGGSGNLIGPFDVTGSSLDIGFKLEGAQAVKFIGGNFEFQGSAGIDATTGGSAFSMDNVAIRDYGSPRADRYSVRVADNNAVITGCTLGVTSSTTGAAIKQTHSYSRNLRVNAGGNTKADLYSGTTRITTINISNGFPTMAQFSGEAASAGNYGSVWRLAVTGGNDQLNMSVKNASGAYTWANLLQYHFDKGTHSTGAAWLDSPNVFTGSSQTIRNGSNPQFKVLTGADGALGAVFGISTSNGAIATGSSTGNTAVVARPGGDLDLATSSSGTRIVRVKIKKSGVLHLVPQTTPVYADNDSAIAGRLVAGDVYRTAGGALRIVVSKKKNSEGAGDSYTGWSSTIPEEEQRAKGADPDGDGFTNLQEFLLGGSPVEAEGSLTTSEQTKDGFIFRWSERTDGNYVLQEGTTLDMWSTSPAVPSLSGNQAELYSQDYIRKEAVIPGDSARKFVRVLGVINP